ncbi:calcium-dependent phosphotriesterase [Aspergillus ibericus CBS 121593]|uniref:Calcium-dependent phosphotriesterase n=1 Tax=Aspergillus ibericus CBS 121593 TaxID=1448316 RepID=A0A395GKY8_9EURO|nr:calcium-dependent phosphotriesterase [Aspergillus ibericus CBS 121593]RAK95946.1 calcium-dependent phosphotriesterase [Aspergillus ibericus CBS 121593]
MAGFLGPRAIFWAFIVLTTAVIYKTYIHNFIFLTLGIGREIQPIEDFQWTCERVRHSLLEGCEDLWLDEQNRKLYAACNSLESRKGWSPGGNNYNISARSRTDHIAVMDVDQPGSDGLYGLRQLKISGYQDDLDLHGFDVRRIKGRLRFWLINHRPPVDHATGEFLDALVVGANSTVEIFDLDETLDTLEHVNTVASEAIVTPNGVAVEEDGLGFVITNDHNTKTGTFRNLEMLSGGGSLAYCRSNTGKCHIAADRGFSMANGIAHDKNGYYYVANSASGLITVHKLVNNELIQVESINTGYPMDNLWLDVDGNLIAAAFPDLIGLVRSSIDPYNSVAPATVLMINDIAKQLKTYGRNVKLSKLVEDRDAKSLPSSTVAVHDAKGHKLFLAGMFSPFITICEQRP